MALTTEDGRQFAEQGEVVVATATDLVMNGFSDMDAGTRLPRHPP